MSIIPTLRALGFRKRKDGLYSCKDDLGRTVVEVFGQRCSVYVEDFKDGEPITGKTHYEAEGPRDFIGALHAAYRDRSRRAALDALSNASF